MAGSSASAVTSVPTRADAVHLGAGLSRQPGRRQQRRLPDPGFTANDQRPAGALGQPADQVGHDVEFALAPIQRPLLCGPPDRRREWAVSVVIHHSISMTRGPN
jgi:hypothetical protein